MANVLLGVTGSVAAIKVPELVTKLRAVGHEVRVVSTTPALYFFSAGNLGAVPVFSDSDEWPGRTEGRQYKRGDSVLHIELRNWADVLLIAPVDANTLAKLTSGICDNCLTCVWRAWDMAKPLILAPAMNTHMWEHPMTRRQLRFLAMDFGAMHVPSSLEDEALIQQLNARSKGFRIVPPISKQLACGDIGVGAMAELSTILNYLDDLLAYSKPSF